MEEKKSKTVRQYFNTIAVKYDFMNSFLSFGMHYLWKRDAVRMAQLRRGDNVLDVCGGTADLAISAAKAVGEGGHVTLYDFSLKMIGAGISKIKKMPVAGAVNPVCGDAECIALRDSTIDAILIGFGLRNLSDMEAGLREMYRVLKPGGKLICLEFSKPLPGLFSMAYDIYSFRVMPVAGRLLAGSEAAYNYLPESIRKFPLPDKLSSIIQAAGFSEVIYKKLTKGIAVIHTGIKID